RARSGGRPAARSMRAPGSEYGPEVSYTVTGGLSSPPNRVGVRVCAISRIGTRRSGREPPTYTLREPGMGRVTASESRSAWRMSSEGTAFIGSAPAFAVLAPRAMRGGCEAGRRRGVDTPGADREDSLRRCQPDQVPRVCLYQAGWPGTPASGSIVAHA